MKPQLKYQAIYSHRHKYPITVMCEFFGVSRSGYYCFVKRMNKPEKHQQAVEIISKCQKETNKTYGYRRVHEYLSTHGIKLNRKTVLRLMNKYNLLSEIRRRRKYRVMSQQLHRYPNLLNRNFSATRPNEKWVTDISYIFTKQGVLYLSIIRDLYDNSIVAYKTGTEQTVNLVLNTIKTAMKKEKVTGQLQLHSDQGAQYVSHEYYRLTQSYNITPSMSRRGNPYDNALAENFFSILKTECIYRQKIDTFTQAQELIHNYIWFYNNERIQLKTKLAPLVTRHQFLA